MQFTYVINGNTLALYPNSLDYSVTYTVYILSGAVEYCNGISLLNSYSFSFTTASNNSGSNSDGGSGGGGGGLTIAQVASNSTKEADIAPESGGIINLGSEVSIQIPAGALQGTLPVNVSIQKIAKFPPEPSGFKILGTAYQFTVDNQDRYTFAKPVTLTFFFAPESLTPGEQPMVFYYDPVLQQWVNIGGTVSGNKITVTVDHFTKYAVMVAKKEAKTPAVVLKDIIGHWAQKDIEKLINMGVITGYPDNTFKPDREMSRAELITILVKILDKTKLHESYNGEQPTPAKPIFIDYNSFPDWAKEYIERGSKIGIIDGYPDNTFRSENAITRAEAASMILRLFDRIKAD